MLAGATYGNAKPFALPLNTKEISGPCKSCICHCKEKHRGTHPLSIAIPKMGKQLSSPFVCYHPAAHFATEVSWVSQAGFMSQAGRLYEL